MRFFFLKCKYFFHLLADSCSEAIILFLFLVNILPPFFLIDFFNETFETNQNTRYVKGSFSYVLGYHLFINQSLVSLCQAQTGQTSDKDSSLILFENKNYQEDTFSFSSIFLCNYLLATCANENVSFRNRKVFWFLVITKY